MSFESRLRALRGPFKARGAYSNIEGRPGLAGASPRAGGPGGPVEAPHLVVWREELHDEGRDAVLHLGERHRVDDLVADAVVVLPAEVRLAPQVVEFHDAEGVRHLLRIDALRLLQRGDEGEGRIGEVDAGRVPFAVLLRVARLPALDLLRQRRLDEAVHP